MSCSSESKTKPARDSQEVLLRKLQHSEKDLVSRGRTHKRLVCALVATVAGTYTIAYTGIALPAKNPWAVQLVEVVQGQKKLEGAGVRVCRTVEPKFICLLPTKCGGGQLGTPELKNLDPFLLLDELRLPDNQASAGFPSHPHRGFETCTIMIEGRVEHKDSAGNHVKKTAFPVRNESRILKGVIGPGGVQWMTAGRGIMHSEMPKKSDTGKCWGFQLWINLPKKDKMIKPRYQDYQAEDIPHYGRDGAYIRVLGGTSGDITGPITFRNPGMLLDVTLQSGCSFEQEIPAEWNAMAYACDGRGELSGNRVAAEQAAVFAVGDRITARASTEQPFRFLVIAGKPLKESIVQHGPFVMNTQEEILQAFLDYESGKLQNPDDDVWSAH